LTQTNFIICLDPANVQTKDYPRFCNVPDFVPLDPNGRFGVDNLEYHLMNREGQVHDYMNVNRSLAANLANQPAALDSNDMLSSIVGPQVIHIVNRKASTSDEDLSDDHDYYNDNYDNSKRELRPLNQRRNETTV